MQLESNKLSSYYNQSSRRPFFFFRLAVGGSMFLLLIALTVNLLNPNQTQDVRSRAASNQQDTSVLPSLPPGCRYTTAADGSSYVACEEVPSPTAPLPDNCQYEVVGNEYVIRCKTSGGFPNITISPAN